VRSAEFERTAPWTVGDTGILNDAFSNQSVLVLANIETNLAACLTYACQSETMAEL